MNLNLERLQKSDGLDEGLVHPPLLCVVFNNQPVKCGSVLLEKARTSLEDLPLSSSSSCVGLTRAHRAPSCVATIVAARGVLYMRASSPKLPLLSYFPTHKFVPSFCTKISNVPLRSERTVQQPLINVSICHYLGQEAIN